MGLAAHAPLALAALGAAGCHAVRPAPPAPVDAPDVGGADIRWYDVSGDDVPSLRASVGQAAPRNDQDEPTLGKTQWSAVWRWEGAGEPCRVSSLAMDLTVVVWLPRWTPGPRTDPALVARWRGFLGALTQHERGHVELVRAQVEALEELLRTVDCAEVDLAGRVGIEAIEALNAAYDTETGHGAAQGARWWTAPEWGSDADLIAPWAP